MPAAAEEMDCSQGRARVGGKGRHGLLGVRLLPKLSMVFCPDGFRNTFGIIDERPVCHSAPTAPEPFTATVDRRPSIIPTNPDPAASYRHSSQTLLMRMTADLS